MKKWMMYSLIGACTAGMAMAEDAVPWWKKPFVKNADEQTQVIPPAPAPVPAVQAAPAPQMPRMQQREGMGDRPYAQMSPEKMEKMKAQHEELMRLGEAARNETDPAKKEMLVGQLRAKLTEIADKMQAEARKRFEQAEKELPKLKERMAAAEKNKAARIEEQVQRILSGQPMAPFEGKRPEPPPGGGKNKKGPRPPVKE